MDFTWMLGYAVASTLPGSFLENSLVGHGRAEMTTEVLCADLVGQMFALMENSPTFAPPSSKGRKIFSCGNFPSFLLLVLLTSSFRKSSQLM